MDDRKRINNMRKNFKKATSLALALSVAFTGVVTNNQSVNAAAKNTADVYNGQSINEAIKNVATGGTVNIHPGTYKEAININKSVSLKGVGNSGEIKLDGSNFNKIDNNGKATSENSEYMIRISVPNVTIDNIDISGLYVRKEKSFAPVGIDVVEGASDVTIKNCEIHDMGCVYNQKVKDVQKDILILKTEEEREKAAEKKKLGSYFNAHAIKVASYGKAISGVTVDNCRIHDVVLGNSEALVFNGNISGTDNKWNKITNNTVYDCDNIGIDLIGYEEGSNYKANHVEVSGNKVVNISSDPNKNYTYISKCAGGIYVDGGETIKINDNFVANSDIGIEVASEAEGGETKKVEVEHNTLVNNNAFAGITIGGSSDDNGYASNCTIKNNSIYNEDAGCLVLQQAAKDINKTNYISNNILIATKNAEPFIKESSNPGYETVKNNIVSPYSDAYKKYSKDETTKKIKASVTDKATDVKNDKLYIVVNTDADLSEYGSRSFNKKADGTKPTEEKKTDAEKPVEKTTEKATEEKTTEKTTEKATEEKPVIEPVVEPETDPVVENEPEYNIESTSFYTVSEGSDDTIKIKYKKTKKAENWKHLAIDFENVDLSQYKTVKLTVVPSRKGVNLGITNQDEDDPIFYRNHWASEGKFNSTKKTTITVNLDENNKDGVFLYFDPLKNDYNKNTQTFKIVSIDFE